MSASAFSAAGLARLRAIMARHVESGYVPGLVTLVSRRGESRVEAIGTLAARGTAPMRRDTIFRIASVTKPIVAAAAMILVEEARLRLDDPVDCFLPELANRRVLRSLASPLDDTVPAARPISLRDLLTFRLGIGAIMAMPGTYPLQAAMAEAGVAPGPVPATLPPDEMMLRYGRLPLAHQPGEKWLYHSGAEILGVLIARASGQSLGAFLRERLFAPLGMDDTGFSVPPGKLDRLATCYQVDAQGGLAVFDAAAGGRLARPPAFESGGGGLVSTADDCHAFFRMMLDRGKADGVRILSRPSVELMTMDHLTPAQKAASPFFPGFWDSHGWGFGMAVVTRRENLCTVPGRFGWDGGYGTSAYADPREDLIGIMLTQRLSDSPDTPHVYADFWTAAYQAIDD